MEDQKIKGKDSLIGKYVNEEMEIRFDYGRFCNDCGKCASPVNADVDNKSAEICTYEIGKVEEDKKYVKAIRFLKLGSSKEETLAFLVSCKTIECQTNAEKIIRSVKFK